MAESLTKRLQRFFGYETKADLDSANKTAVKPVDRKSGRPIDLPSRTKKLWDWYVKETNDKLETLKNREDRYKDIDFMIYNEPLASFSVDLYADEIAQADDQFNLITVKAKDPKVETRIRQLFDQWEVDQEYIREVGYNLVAYGDSFEVNEIDEKKGIISSTPVSVYDVTDRLEFKLSETKKAYENNQRYSYLKLSSIDKFLKELEKEEKTFDFSKSYLSYLFGFVIGSDSFVYPWQVSHYRLETRRSEFFPFGRSLLINLIGPYRQLKTSMNLMALTRALKFPKEVYEVQTSDEMTATDKWAAVEEAKNELQNLGQLNRAKDEFSIGDELWIPEGLIKHDTITNDLRIEDIADIELLRENFIMGTKIPKGYLIADRSGGWGTSGQSLLQQSKPFGRAVYSVQSAILKELAHKIRMHFLMTGEFEKEFTEFQLSLNFPVIEEAADRQRMKQDSLRMANDIIDNIKTALGLRDATVPPEVVKDIFSKFSFLDPEILNDLVDTLAKQIEKPDDQSTENESGRFFESYKRLDESVLSTAYFESLRKFDIKECHINGRHYLTSSGRFIQNEYSPIYKMFRFIEKERRING
jgi:hypothetical protein